MVKGTILQNILYNNILHLTIKISIIIIVRLIFQFQQEEYMVLYHSITVLLSHSIITPPLPPRNLCNLVKLADQQLAEHKYHYLLLHVIAIEDN